MSSPTHLQAARRNYATDAYWKIRQDIDARYTLPNTDPALWMLARHDWRGDERVLDVGAGVSQYAPALHDYLPNISYHALDLSMGMLRVSLARRTKTNANVLALPFADGTFDVVMAHHMLNHVEDVDQALHEIKRVLKPDGLVMIMTHAHDSLRQYQELIRHALLLLSTPGQPYRNPQPIHAGFTLESGTIHLSRRFYAITRHDLPALIVMPSADPAITYMETLRHFYEPFFPPSVRWDDVMMLIRNQIERIIAHTGEMVIEKLTGVLIATDSGGFIREYLRYTGAVDQRG